MGDAPTGPIENRADRRDRWDVDLALECVAAGIDAANPESSIHDVLSLHGSTLAVRDDEFDLATYDRVLVLGGGNAAGYATLALESVLGDHIDDGIVVTDNPVETSHVRILAGDHPTPSDRGVRSTRELLSLADTATAEDLVITLVTGGGSALLAAPDGIELGDLQATTAALIESGATIHEINAVRKHLSAIKGGRLARRLRPATTVGVLCSDVVGDDQSVIASGPISPDRSTYTDAVSVIERYDVDVPESVGDLLRAGAAGDRTETPTADGTAFDHVHTYVVASNEDATAAAAETARENGFSPLVLGSRLRGRAREVAKVVVGIAEQVRATGEPVEPPAVLLSGGETTVAVAGGGIGGPNHELALSAALELDDDGIVVAAVDTDGIDGNTESAGAVVTSETVENRRDARLALDRNDAGSYLDAIGARIHTGPTTTNVNDLHVIVVGE